MAPLEQLAQSAGELNILDPAGDLAKGIGKDLAMLPTDQLGQFLTVGVQQMPEREENLGATGDAGAPQAG